MSFRDNPLGELKVPLTWTAAIAILIALVFAITLVATDRRGEIQAEAYGVTRKAADAVAAPVGGLVAKPVGWADVAVENIRGYFFAVSENRRLKQELKTAREWRDRALALDNLNERYRVLLDLKTDPPIPMVSARIVTDARGPFANTRLANVGKEKGVKAGYPVMSENGLVGRIIGVTTGASRVLLLTDVTSRTPVMVERNNNRSILTGDGGPNPRLEFLRGSDPVKPGDRIVTSGDGGVLPRGLPVGIAAKGLDGRWRVVLASDRAPIDYVRIMRFEDFAQLTNQAELARMSVPPPSSLATASVGVTPSAAPAAGTVSSAVRPKPVAAPVTAAAPPPRRPAAPATRSAPSTPPPPQAPPAATLAPQSQDPPL